MKTNKKGISLIVLVITIIILAILAATVIISIVNTGVINSAKDAVEAQKLGQVRDIASAAWGHALIDPSVSTPAEYLNHIINALKGEGYTDSELDKYIIVADVNGVTVNLKDTVSDVPDSDESDIPGGDGPEVDPKSLVAMYKSGTLKQGDYVDYNPSPAANWTLTNNADGAYTCIPLNGSPQESAISQEDLNWRILGYDEENKELLLIAGSPTCNSIYVDYSPLGYNNYINALNNTCRALYSNTTLGAVARSININDIDTYLGGNAYDKTTYGNEVDSNGNVTQIKPGGYGYVSTTFYSKWYIDSITGNFELGDTEKLFNSSSTVYSLNFQNVTTNNTILGILSGPNRNYSYWVASRGIEVVRNDGGTEYAIGGIARVNSSYIAFIERANPVLWSQNSYGQMVEALPTTFRPVVALPSSITLDDVTVIEDAPQETWVFPTEYGTGGGENWD